MRKYAVLAAAAGMALAGVAKADFTLTKDNGGVSSTATGGTPGSRAARASGEEYLLERRLFRRLSTGKPADEQFLRFAHPNRWHYDVLRALDYFRDGACLTGGTPDARLGEAVDHVRSRCLEDGRWPLDWSPPGRVWFEVDDGPGQPSRWITLRAMRVLRWCEA